MPVVTVLTVVGRSRPELLAGLGPGGVFVLEDDLAGRCGEQVLVLGGDTQAVEGEQQVMGQDGPQSSGEGPALGQVGEGSAGVLERQWPGGC